MIYEPCYAVSLNVDDVRRKCRAMFVCIALRTMSDLAMFTDCVRGPDFTPGKQTVLKQDVAIRESRNTSKDSNN